MTAGPGPGSRKPRRRRLSRSAEFDRVYREGRSHANRFLVLHAFPRGDDEEARLGVSVGRKVGGAVDRNRVKRALREAFWGVAGELPGGHDYVLVGRADVGGLIEREGTPGLERCLGEVLGELGGKSGEAPAGDPSSEGSPAERNT